TRVGVPQVRLQFVPSDAASAARHRSETTRGTHETGKRFVAESVAAPDPARAFVSGIRRSLEQAGQVSWDVGPSSIFTTSPCDCGELTISSAAYCYLRSFLKSITVRPLFSRLIETR